MDPGRGLGILGHRWPDQHAPEPTLRAMRPHGRKPERGQEAPLVITPRAIVQLLKDTRAAVREARRRRRRADAP
jgi:hypothetical protein